MQSLFVTSSSLLEIYVVEELNTGGAHKSKKIFEVKYIG